MTVPDGWTVREKGSAEQGDQIWDCESGVWWDVGQELIDVEVRFLSTVIRPLTRNEQFALILNEFEDVNEALRTYCDTNVALITKARKELL